MKQTGRKASKATRIHSQKVIRNARNASPTTPEGLSPTCQSDSTRITHGMKVSICGMGPSSKMEGKECTQSCTMRTNPSRCNGADNPAFEGPPARGDEECWKPES